MTERTFPSGIRDAYPDELARVWRRAGGDWVVPSDEVMLADREGLSGTPLDAFGESHSGSSFDVTISAGEAVVVGVWIGKDTQTTVTLDAQVNNQTVYAGWSATAENEVIIGLDGAFSMSEPADQRLPIWEFDTDGSGVTDARDLRPLGEQIDVRNEGSSANADNLGNIPPEDYVRGDGSTTDSRVFVNSSGDFAVGNPNHPSAYYLWGRQDRGNLRLGNGVINTKLFNYIDAAGYDLRNVGTMSATNANVGGSPVLTGADESGLDVSSADNATNADNIGQNSSAGVQAGSKIQMNQNQINELPAAEYGGQAVSRDYADSRYIEQNDESGLDVSSANTAGTAQSTTAAARGEIAQRHMTHTPAYELKPNQDVILGRFAVPNSAAGHHLWAVGTNELDGKTSFPQFKIFNRQDGSKDEIFTTNADFDRGFPLHSNYRNLIELRLHNSNNTDTIEATASYSLTIDDY